MTVLVAVRVGVVLVCSRPRELLRASASDSSAAEGVSGGVRFSWLRGGLVLKIVYGVGKGNTVSSHGGNAAPNSCCDPLSCWTKSALYSRDMGGTGLDTYAPMVYRVVSGSQGLL